MVNSGELDLPGWTLDIELDVRCPLQLDQGVLSPKQTRRLAFVKSNLAEFGQDIVTNL